jgi:hypothetical protein
MENVWGARPEQHSASLCIDARLAAPAPCDGDDCPSH